MTFFINDIQKKLFIKNVLADLETVLNEFEIISKQEGSFFGIKTNNGVIQFAWENEDKWLVDLPKPPSFLNPQRYASYDKCVEIIKSIFKGVLPEEIDGLVKVKIMEETLDIVLEKKE